MRRRRSWGSCGGGERRSLAGLGGQPRRLSPHESLSSYFVITPQAMRSPELPEGSVFMSSAFA